MDRRKAIGIIADCQWCVLGLRLPLELAIVRGIERGVFINAYGDAKHDLPAMRTYR